MTKTPKLKWRPYGKRIYQAAAQDAMAHHRAYEIHASMFPDTRNGGHGSDRPNTPGSSLCYADYAAASTNQPAQYIRDLVRIGRLIPEDFLVSIIGTELDQFMYLLNVAKLTEEHRNEKCT